MQHVIDDLLLREFDVARMSDTEPQPPEFAVAELRYDVLEAVMPGAAAAKLELHAPRLHVELVVRNKYLER